MKYLFLGDSITDACHNLYRDPGRLGNGFVRIISDRLEDKEMKDVEIINEGHDGFTVRGLLLLLDMDCISKKPDVVTILIGINDVAVEMNTGKTLKEQNFEENYELLLKRVRSETEARIICMGPFIFPKPEEYLLWNPHVSEAEAIERKLAEKYGAEFIPLHDVVNRAALEEGVDEITVDGTHLTARGAGILADEWLARCMPGFSL